MSDDKPPLAIGAQIGGANPIPLRIKNAPYSLIQVMYDGTIRGPDSLMSADPEGAQWVDSSLLYACVGTAEIHPLFFHYTSLSNLDSIVDSGDLWVSSYDSMNDFEEFQTALNELYLLAVPRFYTCPKLERFWSLIVGELKNEFQCFILSMSREPRSLSMYRAYCRGGGVAIGFPVPLFFEGFDPRWTLGPVLYEKADHRNALSPILENLEALTERSENDDQIREGIGEIRTAFHWTAPFLKNSGFKEEREVRFFTDGRDMRVFERERNGKNVRFVKLSWLNGLVQSQRCDFGLDTIYVSPNDNPKEALTRVARIISTRERKFRAIYDTAIPEIV